jgi:hypothetical protein
MEIQKTDSLLEKIYRLTVRVINFKNKSIKNVNVKIFKLEKEPITVQQWAENLKNGDSFERLILSINTDNYGSATAELAEGVYDIRVEKYGLTKICEFRQNDEVTLIEPRKSWWS